MRDINFDMESDHERFKHLAPLDTHPMLLDLHRRRSRRPGLQNLPVAPSCSWGLRSKTRHHGGLLNGLKPQIIKFSQILQDEQSAGASLSTGFTPNNTTLIPSITWNQDHITIQLGSHYFQNKTITLQPKSTNGSHDFSVMTCQTNIEPTTGELTANVGLVTSMFGIGNECGYHADPSDFSNLPDTTREVILPVDNRDDDFMKAQLKPVRTYAEQLKSTLKNYDDQTGIQASPPQTGALSVSTRGRVHKATHDSAGHSIFNWVAQASPQTRQSHHPAHPCIIGTEKRIHSNALRDQHSECPHCQQHWGTGAHGL